MTWLVASRVGVGLDDVRALGAGAWVPASPLLAVLASCVLLGGHFLAAELWRRVVQDLGGPKVGLRDAAAIFWVANLGRYLPGKLWQIAGLAMLAKRRGVPASTATGAAVLGHGISLVAATLVGLGAIQSAPEGLRKWGNVIAGLMLASVAVGLSPAVFGRAVRAWFRLAKQEVPQSLAHLHGIRWLALYLLNWVVYGTAFWLLVRSFGWAGGLVPVASAFAAAYVLGYLMVFAPAGIGVREGFLIVFLTPHIGPGPSGAIAIISRLWTTVAELLPAALFGRRVVPVQTPAVDEREEQSV